MLRGIVKKMQASRRLSSRLVLSLGLLIVAGVFLNWSPALSVGAVTRQTITSLKGRITAQAESWRNIALWRRADHQPPDAAARAVSPVHEAIARKLQTQAKVKVELFVMSQCPFGVRAEEAIAPVLKEFGDQVDFQLRFIASPTGNGFTSMHGQPEVDEDLRQTVMAAQFPQRYLDYVVARTSDYRNVEWQPAAAAAGMEATTVEQLSRSETGRRLFAENIQRANELHITASPTILLDGEKYTGKILPAIAAATAACQTGAALAPVAVKSTAGAAGTACTKDSECNDNNACTIDACDPTIGCTHTQLICDDSNACTRDTCDPAKGCVYTPLNCDDGNPNTVDSCSSTKGCINTPTCNQVVTNTNDSGTGSLRAAIANACPGGTITFQTGVTTVSLTTAELLINKDLTIDGGLAKVTVTRQTGSSNFRIFNLNSGNITLTNLQVTNGAVVPGGINIGGCGIRNGSSGTVNLTNLTVARNACLVSSGGINGGGIRQSGTGALNINNLIYTANTGAGVYTSGLMVEAGTVTVTNSTFSGNSSSSNGSALLIVSGSATLINCTLTQNSAARGGGIYNDLGTLKLKNTIVAGNSASLGPDINGTITSLGYNLIGNNASATVTPTTGDKIGGGANPVIDPQLGPLADNGGPTQTHALLANSPALNAGGDVATLIGTIASNAASLTLNDASAFPVGSILQIDSEQLSVSARTNNTLTVTRGANNTAPASHSDGAAVNPAFDQRGSGFARKAGRAPDIGAFEVQNNPPTLTLNTTAPSLSQGTQKTGVSLGSVNDVESPVVGLQVAVTSTNPSNGVMLTQFTNSNGLLSATIQADCTATNASFTLSVMDEAGAVTTAQLNVAVTPNTPPVVSYPNNPGATFGTGLTINPLATPTDNGSIASFQVFSIVPALASGITVDSAGVVTVASTVPANIYNVTIRVLDNCGLSTDASFTLGIVKATPIITWANPDDIVYGTALSTTQLNATANVAGSFSYAPGSGAILNAGNGQTLSVTFTPTDSTNYNTATKSVAINVLKATPTITWNNPADIVYGTALSVTQLNATASTTGTFVYAPASGALLNAGNGQSLSVNFTPTDTANYNTATKSVVINVLKATPTITWSNPADIVYGTALSTTQLNATANVAGSFSYTPASGSVLNAGDGQTLSVTFNPTDSTNYNTASKNAAINVLKATPTVTWNNPVDIVYGTALGGTQLNATASIAGSFSYSPAAGTVLNAGSGQTLTVNFTPTDTANFNTASKNVVINVLKATPTITWNNPADIVYGTALSATQLNATANVTGSFSYMPASGTVLNAGNGQSLSVNFTPTDTVNYNTATKTVAINVLKATPSITWDSPVDIVYGTALNATQLNATASIAGTFNYTPAAGTVLNAGNGQTLSANFTPTDTANYNSPPVKSVSINVGKAPLSVVANNVSRGFGDPNPPLIGVINGIVNSDPITATYATTATQNSPIGTYPIVPTLVDPNNRLVNYNVSITNGTLTVKPYLNDGVYTMSVTSGNKCIQPQSPFATAGIKLIQNTCSGGNEQKWSLQHQGNNVYRLTNVATGMTIETASGLLSDYAQIDQASWSNAAYQKWQFRKVGNAFELVSTNSNLLLEVLGIPLIPGTDNATINGVTLDQHISTSTANQRFIFQ